MSHVQGGIDAPSTADACPRLLRCCAAAAAAATTSFSGTLLIHGQKSKPFPCTEGLVCGEGKLHGLGAVGITIDEEEFTEIPESDCFEVASKETITVLDGSGSIALESSGTGCAPGGSQSGPHERSFGNPFISNLTFAVNGANSTGAYAGASGEGTLRFKFAGATGSWNIAGTITSA